jgi:hypothetical protein
MNTLVLKQNKLLMAGILAFAVLMLTQISVQAWDYGGGWSSIQNVGTVGINSWQIVGNALVDSDLNAGQMPSVITGAATGIGTPGGISTATLHGSVPVFGVDLADATFAGFRYWTDPATILTAPETAVTGAGTYSATITNYDRTQIVNYQSYTRTNGLYVYGAIQTFAEASQSGFSLLHALLTLIIAAGVLVWVVRNGVTVSSLLAILIGIIAIFIVNGIIG